MAGKDVLGSQFAPLGMGAYAPGSIHTGSGRAAEAPPVLGQSVSGEDGGGGGFHAPPGTGTVVK
ncbi:MAG: hypothetical protein WCO52_06660, partial [bacterium]